MSGDLFEGEVIDLSEYLSNAQLASVTDLYKAYGWDEPASYEWLFEDVCALYFRVDHYREVLRGPFGAAGAVKAALAQAISDCLKDEFS